ncbi:SRPBCC domain-containing protein [Pelagibius sp.]|uniref:SRPBCC domain-containing protein n=1 Tax=Pelagibius sp. TaxID=1931238 RepID=UPI002613EAE3|nr:SRPBCC domain-containing protein [Pelagibius sp.]
MRLQAAGVSAEDRALFIARVFDAPRDLVFKVWTRPEHIVHWAVPPGFSLLSCEEDLRRGGRHACCLRSPDGSTFRLGGVYCAVTPPERLVSTFTAEGDTGVSGRETLVTVTFEDVGEDAAPRTRLSLRQGRFDGAAERDVHAGAMAACFDRVGARLAVLQGAEVPTSVQAAVRELQAV